MSSKGLICSKTKQATIQPIYCVNDLKGETLCLVVTMLKECHDIVGV